MSSTTSTSTSTATSTATLATNPTALFQHYVQNIFVFPKEIKNDIVYCQRALKAHIKVHQMVLDVYRTQLNPDPVQKKRIIDELESQIYEINAEQQFLLLRLRRIIDDFYKTYKSRNNAVIIPELMNDVISRELVPMINDPKCLVYPFSVHLRCTEEKLIEKYFEVKTEKKKKDDCFEVLDSDEEEQYKREQTKQALAQAKSKLNGKSNVKNYVNSHQMSLLKPMAQRPIKIEQPPLSAGHNDQPYIDASQFLEVMDETATGDLKGFKPIMNGGGASSSSSSALKRKLESTDVYPVSIQESKTFRGKDLGEDCSVPKNVKMSRFNLREALKKAHTETLAAAAAKSSSSSLPRSRSAQELLNGKGGLNNGVVLPMKTIELTSSSGESTPERSSTPQQSSSTSSGPTEIVDTRIKPEEFGQEMFLRMFGLYTPEMKIQMQQRRSKRKRRNVQRNERSDFHYGRIEYANLPPVEIPAPKKPKEFLQSPQVKRKVGRPPKRRSVEKSDDTISRSSSSSPDEKRRCNECLKSGGSMDICEGCKAFYHQSCHREKDTKDFNPKKSVFIKAKLCPVCERFQAHVRSEAKHYQLLQKTAKSLEQQMVIERNRSRSLKAESKNFKTQMSTLYTIVRAIKSDPENSSD